MSEQEKAGAGSAGTPDETQTRGEGQAGAEPLHTAAEAELLAEVKRLRAEIAAIKDENRKLFLKLGGDGSRSEKTVDQQIAEDIQKFRESGYNPNILIGGA